MRKPKRLEVTKIIPSIVSLSDLEGSVSQICGVLQEAEQKLLSQGFLRVSFQFIADEDHVDVEAVAVRLETDKEYEKRLLRDHAEKEKAAVAKAEREKAEREMYEILKKKFG